MSPVESEGCLTAHGSLALESRSSVAEEGPDIWILTQT